MQCARCAKPLPEHERVCPFCGLPVNPQAEDAAAPVAAPLPVQSAGETGFVFQEFGGQASAPPQPPITGIPAPFPEPPVGGLPGYPEAVPPPQPQAGPVGYYPPGIPLAYTPMPAPAPAQKARRGLSTGWIVLYVFLGLTVLFTGVGVLAYQLGASFHASTQARADATRAAAMQLYQQITSQAPTLQDSLTDPNSNSWNLFDKGDYGCALDTNGLRVYINEVRHFIYCTYTAAHVDSFAFQVQMQISSGDAGGFVFRIEPLNGNTSESLYFFSVTSSGNYKLYLDKDTQAGKISTLSSGMTQAMDSQSQTNTLTLIAKGSYFDLYINQEFVTEQHDTTLSFGPVGLLADANTDSTSVLYTNAKFWYLGN